MLVQLGKLVQIFLIKAEAEEVQVLSDSAGVLRLKERLVFRALDLKTSINYFDE